MLWGMKMTRRNTEDDDALEQIFANARATPPAVGSGFHARIVALGLATQPPQAMAGGRVAPPLSFWREAALAVGGWWGAGGLTTAMALGVVIGLMGRIELPIGTPNDGFLDLMPAADGLFSDSPEEK